MFANTTGANNTAIGANALEANTTGIRIVAVGYNALSSDVTPEESSQKPSTCKSTRAKPCIWV